MAKSKVYLDYMATTPVKREVVLAMAKYWKQDFGNPGSITTPGVRAKEAVESSRQTIAGYLNCLARDIYFTSGGTESNNLAILGVYKKLLATGLAPSKLHAVTSVIEHSSVFAVFKYLETQGVKVTYIAPDYSGLITEGDLRKALRPNTFIVSLGYVNNEVGTIQDLKLLAKVVRQSRAKNKLVSGETLVTYPYFHTDASQAGLYADLNLSVLGVDLLTLDAQKIGGPKGIGLLYVRSGVLIDPLLYGGGQESGLRSGTEPVPLIVGLAKAFTLARTNWVRQRDERQETKDYLLTELKSQLPQAVVNNGVQSLPNLVNLYIPGLDAEFAVLQLDEAGFVVSAKSACATDTSTVLTALYGPERAVSSLRISFDSTTKHSELKAFVQQLVKVVAAQI